MFFFTISSDIFDIKKSVQRRRSADSSKSKALIRRYHPLVTVIVPAHNEEITLRRNLNSIAKSSYDNIELIIVNDSSTDSTYEIARYFQRVNQHRFKKIKLLNISVRGKAKALNAGLAHARGSLFMCLDADSALTPTAITSAVETFRDNSVGALSANVKIFPAAGLLNTIQRIEYLVCYQMKKAETLSKTQYIIGGIGSMYRTRIIRKLKLYDTDTITEDIDLSMQMLQEYGRKYVISYDPRVVVYTEAVLNITGLMVQRFRWKYGRYQVFLKRRDMFWSRTGKHNPLLSWIYLPYALFAELAYAFEPFVILFVMSLILIYGDVSMLVGAFLTFMFYTIFVVSGATQSYSRKERAYLVAYAPIAYVGMYILSFVEYVATIKGMIKLPVLLVNYRSGNGNCEWTPVARSTKTAKTAL